MEQALDDFLSNEDYWAEQDAKPRPFEKRALPCFGGCLYYQIHHWNPETEQWECAKCGTPWRDQSDFIDRLSWDGAPYMRPDFGAYLSRMAGAKKE